MTTYPDWEPAAKESRNKKAISRGFKHLIPNDGRVLSVAIVKPLHGDPYMVYNFSPGLKVAGVKVTAQDVDKIRVWQAF